MAHTEGPPDNSLAGSASPSNPVITAICGPPVGDFPPLAVSYGPFSTVADPPGPLLPATGWKRITLAATYCRTIALGHLGRRDLERRFRKLLNCSVLDDIRGVRVQRVKNLLAETTLSMAAVSPRCGFSSPERMTVVFGQITGMSPSTYRRHVSTRSS